VHRYAMSKQSGRGEGAVRVQESELALSSKPWTKCVLSDMESLEIQTIKDLETKSKKREHFRMMTEARIL